MQGASLGWSNLPDLPVFPCRRARSRPPRSPSRPGCFCNFMGASATGCQLGAMLPPRKRHVRRDRDGPALEGERNDYVVLCCRQAHDGGAPHLTWTVLRRLATEQAVLGIRRRVRVLCARLSISHRNSGAQFNDHKELLKRATLGHRVLLMPQIAATALVSCCYAAQSNCCGSSTPTCWSGRSRRSAGQRMGVMSVGAVAMRCEASRRGYTG